MAVFFERTVCYKKLDGDNATFCLLRKRF